MKSGKTVEVWCSSQKFLGVDMRFVEENRQTNIAWMILMTGGFTQNDARIWLPKIQPPN